MALAELLKHVRRADEAADLEARSQGLLKHWMEKLPSYPVALRQAFLSESGLHQVARPQAGF